MQLPRIEAWDHFGTTRSAPGRQRARRHTRRITHKVALTRQNAYCHVLGVKCVTVPLRVVQAASCTAAVA